MKKMFVTLALLNGFSLFGVCHKCEIIRAENAKKVNPYVYYEDYKNAQDEPKNEPKAENREEEKAK